MATRLKTFGLVMALQMSVALPAVAQDAATTTTMEPVTVTATAWDPLEGLNRMTFAFNSTVAMAVAPVIETYRSNVPESVQSGIDNVFTNLREPVTTVSSALQGDLHNAGVSAGRFAVNLVAGIGGIHDAATPMGLVSRPEDIGSTLCSYGVGAGPYLVLPLLGPSTGRETVGMAVSYSAGYEITHDFAATYFITDGAVATLSDAKVEQGAPPADSYAEQRDAYVALRDEICRDAVPAGDLKASPFGRIIRP